MLFVVICPKSERMLGAYNLISRQREIETNVFSFYYLPKLADRRTSWSLHSAAVFSLETRTLLSSKIASVNNQSRGNSVKY